MQTRWVEYIGSPMYLISDDGQVFSKHRNRLLKPARCKQKGGLVYHGYMLTDRIQISAHRLVAIHFIPNPDNKPNINHKDFDTLNNHHTNLEWCTQKENVEWSAQNGRLQKSEAEKISRSKKAKERTTYFYNDTKYNSLEHAASSNSVCERTITRRCKKNVGWSKLTLN